ncbi:MAG: hypothetical protein H7338_19570 [Candidatus Sericytochromatia bacterium]|nr:hypothetical protein [Candidatus Sericytochromatia bacterium]
MDRIGSPTPAAPLAVATGVPHVPPKAIPTVAPPQPSVRAADQNAAKPNQTAKAPVREVALPHHRGASLPQAAGYTAAIAHLPLHDVALAHAAEHALVDAARQPNPLMAMQAVSKAADAIRRLGGSPASQALLKLIGHHFHGPLAAIGATHLPHEAHAMVDRLAGLCKQLQRREATPESIRQQTRALMDTVAHLTIATAETVAATQLAGRGAAKLTHASLTVINNVGEAMRQSLLTVAPTAIREQGAAMYVKSQLLSIARLSGATGTAAATRATQLGLLMTKMGLPFESQIVFVTKLQAALTHAPAAAKLFSASCAALESLATKKAIPGVVSMLCRTMVATTNPILMLMALKDVGAFALAVTPVRGTDLTAGEWWGAELEGLAATHPILETALTIPPQLNKAMAAMERMGIKMLTTRHATQRAGSLTSCLVPG